MIREASAAVQAGRHLSPEEMRQVMEEILTGTCSTEEIMLFLTALADKGETAQEITSAALVMRRHAVAIRCDSPVILDTCGTGGDKKNTFNISTTAAFVIAGCGVTIAKHGNRSVSSMCGSADILEALGVAISLTKENIEACLAEIGIAFLYAPDFHPAMKFASAARKQLNRRTIFNILGPLCNPAGATHQLIGVYSQGLGGQLAEVAGNLGTRHCLCVHGEGVIDEATTTGWTEIHESRGGEVKTYRIAPEDLGFARTGFDALTGADRESNAALLLKLLGGEPGPARDIVLLNAGAALYAADKAVSIREGIDLARESIDSGRAMRALERLRDFTSRKQRGNRDG